MTGGNKSQCQSEPTDCETAILSDPSPTNSPSHPCPMSATRLCRRAGNPVLLSHPHSSTWLFRLCHYWCGCFKTRLWHKCQAVRAKVSDRFHVAVGRPGTSFKLLPFAILISPCLSIATSMDLITELEWPMSACHAAFLWSGRPSKGRTANGKSGS